MEKVIGLVATTIGIFALIYAMGMSWQSSLNTQAQLKERADQQQEQINLLKHVHIGRAPGVYT